MLLLFKKKVCLGFALWKVVDQEASYYKAGSFSINILCLLL